MERNFTIETVGSKKGQTLHFNQKLLSLLSLFLFLCSVANANNYLDIVVSSTDVTCPGSNDGTATVTPFDAWDPITYNWSNGGTTPTITGLAPGLYEVTVIDGDGAIEIGSTLVGEGDGLDLFMSASYETCDGSNDGTASVNASGGSGSYTYLWSTGETFVVASDLTAGTYTVTVTDSNGCSAVGSIDVELSPEGVWLMTSSTNADCGLDNGTAHVSVMSGTAPYIITWSNGDTGEDISGLAPGTYTVSVVDANGCSNTESVTIGADSDLNVSISKEDADCGIDNGSATVTVNGGSPPYIYEWSTGANTPTITGLGAGIYTVTVSDNALCANVLSVEINQDSGIDVEVTGIDADCNLSNGSATATASNGVAPYTYLWSNGATSSMITGLASGTYTVTATDANGCENTASVEIDGIGVDGGEITTNDDLNICAGDGVDDIVIVDLNGADGENSRWVLTDPAGNIIGFSNYNEFNFDGAGTGNCVIWHLSFENGITGLDLGNNVSQLDGCFDFSNSITVIRIDPEGGDISTNDATSFCVGDGIDDFVDVTLSGEFGTNQSWIITDNTGMILGLPAAPPFNFEGAGTGACLIYSVSYEPGLTGLMTGANISDLDGCFELSNNSIEVIRNEIPTVTLSTTDINCAGDSDGSITANAAGGDGNYTYEWSNNATTATITGLDAGLYSVTVTDGNGCSVTANASITEPSALSINTNGINETCAGSSDGSATVTISGGTSPYTYLWSNGETTPTISGLAPGIYNVTATDANGCTISSPMDIVIGSDGITSCSAMVTSSYNEGVQISTFGGSDGTASASAVGGTLPYTYLWSDGQTGPDAINLSAGTYTVTITDANGCSCTSEVTLVDPSKLGNFVWEDLNKNGIQDAGEPGLDGITINLTGTSIDGTPISRTTNTNVDGIYCFDGLLTGSYKVTFDQPSGYAVSPVDAGGDDTVDSDMDPDTGMSEFYDLGPSENNPTVDAGLFQCVSIGDFVFYDGNRDGVQQPWEAGVFEVQVFLKGPGPDGIICTDDDLILDAQYTDGNGRYLFECLDPGQYYVEFSINTSLYMITGQNQGDDELDSDPDPTTGKTGPINVIEGMPDDLSIDAGIYLICDDFNNGGQIGYNQEICPGEFPNTLESITLPAGGYGASEYIWLKSTTGGPIGSGNWMEIPNTNSPTYDPPQLYQTTYFIRCARREGCTEYVAESNAVVIVVNTCIGGLIQNLNATVQNQSVSIDWTTAPENQLFRYRIERSEDGLEYEELGAVNGLGDQQTTNFYNFMDDAPRMGRNIYRIVREDLSNDNRFYSENVEALFEMDGNRFFVYPNPTSKELFVESLQTMNGNATLELYNATGQLLDVVEVDYTLGKAEFDFDKYASGPYFIKIKYADKDDTDVIKIIKE